MKVPPAAWIGSWLTVLSLFLAAPVSALEKRAVPVIDQIDQDDLWNAGATCRVSYYNVCTGWVWAWSGFEDGARLGVVADRCCEDGAAASLLQTRIFLFDSGPPCYYGFTGTIAVHPVDMTDCPIDPPIAIQPYCPYPLNFFSVVSWGGVSVPSRFAIVVTIEDGVGGLQNPATFGSDHPAAGPTGPEACGVCYPTDRAIRSFKYGTIETPLCPGSTFNDGICDANLFWDIDLSCTVATEESSWGMIKSLYR